MAGTGRSFVASSKGEISTSRQPMTLKTSRRRLRTVSDCAASSSRFPANPTRRTKSGVSGESEERVGDVAECVKMILVNYQVR